MQRVCRMYEKLYLSTLSQPRAMRTSLHGQDWFIINERLGCVPRLFLFLFLFLVVFFFFFFEELLIPVAKCKESVQIQCTKSYICQLPHSRGVPHSCGTQLLWRSYILFLAYMPTPSQSQGPTETRYHFSHIIFHCLCQLPHSRRFPQKRDIIFHCFGFAFCFFSLYYRMDFANVCF